MVPPAHGAEVGHLDARSGRQLAHAGAPIALGSAVVSIAQPMGAFRSHRAATSQLRERQVPIDMDAINIEA